MLHLLSAVSIGFLGSLFNQAKEPTSMFAILHEIAPVLAVAAPLAAPAYLVVAYVDLRDALRHRRERKPCLCHFLKACAYTLLGLAAMAH